MKGSQNKVYFPPILINKSRTLDTLSMSSPVSSPIATHTAV